MMADRRLRPFGVFDAKVLAAFDAVPRERFVAKEFVSVAYADTPVRCAAGRRLLLAPLILGRMLQAAEIKPADRALDVAGGSGYSACVLGRLAAEVTALESEALETPFELGDNVTRVVGPVTEGAKTKGPFDVIVINGVIEVASKALLEQLAEGGRLIALERQGAAAQGVRYVRNGESVNRRLEFNASGPLLPEFAAPAGFVF
ncbi:MAG: protein-L-isoaspartate O-methyltransferase [Rhodoblastus sp.]|nr:MAG: protein-L-isoaspartate O-methyltransferase [Rhodoblastus sp.]